MDAVRLLPHNITAVMTAAGLHGVQQLPPGGADGFSGQHVDRVLSGQRAVPGAQAVTHMGFARGALSGAAPGPAGKRADICKLTLLHSSLPSTLCSTAGCAAKVHLCSTVASVSALHTSGATLQQLCSHVVKKQCSGEGNRSRRRRQGVSDLIDELDTSCVLGRASCCCRVTSQYEHGCFYFSPARQQSAADGNAATHTAGTSAAAASAGAGCTRPHST
jgi:hypothetical protein